MTQHADIQPSSLEEVLEILQSEAQSLPPSPTSSRYLRALSSLKSSVMVGTHGPCVHAASQVCGKHSMSASPRVEGNFGQSSDRAAGLSQGENTAPADTPYSILYTAITDWLINQWLLQTPFSTASLYLDIISALYGSAVKAGRLPKTDLFSRLKTQLKQLGPGGWKSGIDDEIFARALRLTKNAANLIADDAIAADLLLLSLTSSLTPLEELALLTKEDCVAVERRASGRRAPSDSVIEGSPCPSPRVKGNYGQSDESAAGLSPAQGVCSPSENLKLIADSSLLSLIFNNLSLGFARRRYLFPLRQSQRTPAQLRKAVFKIVNALFRRARLPQSTDPNQTVEALWAYAALRAGIPASQVVAALGHAPLGLPVLKLSVGSYKLSESGQAANDDLVGTHGSCVRVPSDSVTEGGLRPSPRDGSNHGQSQDRAASYNLQLTTHNSNNCTAGLSPVQGACSASEDLRLKTEDSPNTESSDTAPRADTPYFEEYFASIGKIFLDNPPRWYAMSLRPGVRFTQLTARLDLLYSHKSNSYNLQLTTYNSAPPELFYPSEEIARAIGKKIVIKKRPFIHSVVFFKAKLTDIGRLFAKIGDLAWCYRQSAAPGAPYAEISETQFRRFQQTISTFTPDYEVAASGELELKKNDRVEILGGLFAGHTATFIKSEELRVKGEETANGVAMERRASGRRPQSGESSELVGKRGSCVREPSKGNTHTIYRLNIVGDNGIEWRIGIDKRLAKQKN